jgi:hypothetical protein
MANEMGWSHVLVSFIYGELFLVNGLVVYMETKETFISL